MARLLGMSPDSPGARQVVGISHAPGALVYAIDTRGQQSRELQTWHATDDARRLLFSVSLAPLPPTGESHLQARPQWAVYRDNVFASDGESDTVLRFSIARGQIDTIPLPHAGGRSRVAEDVELPRRASGRERPTPRHTAEWRWENMVTDPDGFLWIAPRDRNRRRKLKTVFVVDPESGRAWRLEVPALPRSFGAPGVYYSADAPAPDLIHVVRRYRVFD